MAKQPASLPVVGRPSGWLWLILAYGAAIRAFNLTEPWGRHLLGIDGAWHSIIGRNLLRHGFFATRGAPVLNPGQSIPGEWTYYLHHPPLLDWIVALSFRIFGIHEWSARLVPLLFSLGTIVLTYRLVSRLFATAQPPALLPLTSAFFMATIPMSAIYGMHVDYHGAIVLGFALAAISAYERLIGTGERRYGLLLIAMVSLCALTDWPGFYLPPLFLAHAWWSRPSAPAGEGMRLARRWTIALLLSSLLLLAVIFLYFQLVHGDLEFVLRKFVQRTYRLKDDTRHAFDLADWIQAIARYQRALNTLPMLIGAAIWILAYLGRRIRGRTALADGFVWILLGFGAMHIVLPFQMAYVHDCLGIYLTPALAVCAAVTVYRLWQAAERMGGIARSAAAAVLALLWMGWAGSITVDYPRARQREANVGHVMSPVALGAVIREQTAPDEAAVVFEEDDCAPALWFYADRPLTPFVYSAADLDELMQSPELWGPECFPIRSRAQPAIAVLPDRAAAEHPEITAFLARYPQTLEQEMRIYDLRPAR